MSTEIVYITSGYCAKGSCVEAAKLPNGAIALRDSKDRGKPPYIFTSDAWADFIAGVKDGEFDFLEHH